LTAEKFCKFGDMKIQNISIKNYKSLVDLEINNPLPFTVFVGPNAAGKSNIFEAIDFFYHFIWQTRSETLELFGGADELTSKTGKDVSGFNIKIQSEGDKGAALFEIAAQHSNISLDVQPIRYSSESLILEEPQTLYHSQSSNKNLFSEYWKWQYFTRVFIKNKDIERFSHKNDQKLTASCDNLEKVLKRLLKDERKREDIIEWLQLFIPGFENLEIQSRDLTSDDRLFIYEKGTGQPFSSNLISTGTYNIITLLVAVYQSDEPQFLCIEEPENGIHPKVVKELVGFFREQCEKKGHYIWLITHSQTLIRELTPEEIIIVDKIDGKTRIKQIQGMKLFGLKMDDAFLTNSIGGGLPW
jgi:predicted ATPase